MAKRIYSETVKKWLISSGIISGTLITGIFLYLVFLGAITINGYSGDMLCAGTIEDPCYAYINFTANEDIFIYPTDYDPWGRDTIMEFSPAVKSWKLQRSWGDGWRDIPLDKSCTGTWCGLSDSSDTRVFSVAFREGRDYQIRIVAYKHNPTDTIKWGAFDGKIDPVWMGLLEREELYAQANLRKASVGNFSIISQNSIRCLWGLDGKKHCESIVIIENGLNQSYVFEGNKIHFPFKRDVQNLEITYSTNYSEIEREFINWDCIEIESINITDEEMPYLEDRCTETIPDYVFTEWEPTFSDLPPNSVMGMKIKFDTDLWRNSDEKNKFNISLNGESFDLTLDPEIDDCLDIGASGTYIVNDTITMGISPCLNITADDVVLDCDGYEIDGITGNAIEVDRVSGTNVNVTILDCTVNQATYGIYLEYADNINVTNFKSFSAGTHGIYTRYSDSGYYKNITIDGDGDTSYNWYFYEAVGTNTIEDLITYDSSQTFRSYDSTGIDFSNILSYDSQYGVVLRYPYSGSSGINIDNLTAYDGSLYGFYLYQIEDVDVTNSKMYNNTQYDIYVSATTTGQCDGHSFTNVNVTDASGGVNGKFVYEDTASQTIQNEDTNLIILCDSDNTIIENVTVSGYPNITNNGIVIVQSSGVNITNSTISGVQYVIYEGTDSTNNLIWNNIFNRSTGPPYVLSSTGDFNYNISQQTGTRIVGGGTLIGGNVYYNSTGGYYFDCTDSGGNGICDDSLDIGTTATQSIDYLPLSDEYGVASCSLNLSWGPPETDIFRFATCGSSFENSTATPQNQTATYGIDYVCNDGAATGDVQIKLSGSLNNNWTWYASNESDYSSNVTLTTDYQTIHGGLAEDACTYIWHWANCSYVTQRPGPYEQYQCV